MLKTITNKDDKRYLKTYCFITDISRGNTLNVLEDLLEELGMSKRDILIFLRIKHGILSPQANDLMIKYNILFSILKESISGKISDECFDLSFLFKRIDNPTSDPIKFASVLMQKMWNGNYVKALKTHYPSLYGVVRLLGFTMIQEKDSVLLSQKRAVKDNVEILFNNNLLEDNNAVTPLIQQNTYLFNVILEIQKYFNYCDEQRLINSQRK